MKIVLFGNSLHPYTRDVLSNIDFKDHDYYLVESKLTYTTDIIKSSNDVDADFLKSISFSELLNLRILFYALKDPFYALKIFKKMNSKNLIKNKDGKKNIKKFKVKDHNSKKCITILKTITPDFIILCPASSIINEEIIRIPKYGIINAHMGLLPDFRGMNALEWTLFHLGKGFITIHFINEHLDTGDIIKVIPIFSKHKNIKEYRNSGRKLMAEYLIRTIKEKQYFDIKSQDYSEGKQYFKMHEYLIDLIENRMK